MNKNKGIFSIIILLFLFSCFNKKYPVVENEFYEHLQQNYQSYADYKYQNYDFKGARKFYHKVDLIKDGYKVLPEKIHFTTDIYNFLLKDITLEQFYDMRKKMLFFLDNQKGKAEYPQELADLQFYYDCWTLEEIMYEKFSQPVRCRSNFIKLLEYLDIRLNKYQYLKVLPAQTKEEEYIFPKKKEKYIVYFDYDSSSLNDEGTYVIWQLIDKIKKINTPNYTVVITGHTDRKGKNKYNEKLSKRRSNTIKHYLINNGIGAEKIALKWIGEIDPQIITEDESQEQLNRRVDITIDQE